MKRTISILLAVVVGSVATAVIVSNRHAIQSADELARRQAAWAAEKAALEAKLDSARSRPPAVETVTVPGAVTIVTNQPDPQALLNELAALKVTPGQPRSMRHVIGLLDQLAQTGPAALPVISKFLTANADVAYDATAKPPRDVQALTSALAPLTLRCGLFDVVRQIGGDDAEAALAETLSKTGRPIEVAYLTQLLEEMAPGKFRDVALSAAKGLLAGTAPGRERDWLFSILQRFADNSYVGIAQGQLILADGKVDASALRYLQQTMGDKSVAVAAQAYRDARITDADSKESLARVGLAFVGVNEQAEELFHAAVLDPALKPKQRRELAEDLNQDGLANEKAPTPEDVKIMTRRYALTQAYLQTDYVRNDQLLSAGFLEANKDLANMLKRAAANPVK